MSSGAINVVPHASGLRLTCLQSAGCCVDERSGCHDVVIDMFGLKTIVPV